jgi:7-dehydrocholesterol reductase
VKINQWNWFRNTLGPFLLILLCPPFAMIIWYTNTKLAGSIAELWGMINTHGFFATIYTIWHPIFWGSSTAWLMITCFVFLQIILMRILPGKTFNGPITAQGNLPIYKANGLLAFVTTIVVFYMSSFYFHLFPASIIYDHLGQLLGALNIASLLLCLLLYLKGRFAPSSTDASYTGHFIFDYYWGTELYPRLGRWHIKMFITCRFGMMSWGLILLSYAAKQQALFGLSNSMLIAVALQLMYITKFFVWEPGYLRSLDIMHDRAGFYICWGCLVWVPCIYTSPTLYLVSHPIQLNVWLGLAMLMLGTISILINYLADRQRQLIRSTHGNCKIWRKKPVTTIATYTTEQGEIKQSILLASGWWGISRHFHYIPEITSAFFWSLPALFTNFLPYFYVCFLTILLVDRAFRDDKKCLKKYGIYWLQYCEKVPYKIVPFFI